jgi:FAD:protein FMN transferase
METTMDALLSPRRRSLIFGAAGALALVGCGRRAADPSTLHFTGETMGSTYNVKLAHAALDTAGEAAVLEAVRAAFDEVNGRMSIHRPDSELSAFNGQGAGAPIALSTELTTVFAAAQRVSALSQGAFDITVEPLVDAWGFGAEKRRGVPPAAAVQAQRAAVGWRALQLDAERHIAFKRHDGLRVDLGGIAKGYGVDRAAAALDALGIDNYMVEAGGEVRTRGANAERRPWQIGIEQPDAVPQRARRVVPLADRSIATSGDYRNYFEQDGRRYCHEIDPATGAPIAHQLCSVTVLADDCMTADALATALIVLGPRAGWALANRESLAAYFIVRDADGRLHDRATDAFTALA